MTGSAFPDLAVFFRDLAFALLPVLPPKRAASINPSLAGINTAGSVVTVVGMDITGSGTTASAVSASAAVVAASTLGAAVVTGVGQQIGSAMSTVEHMTSDAASVDA
jgi:hypothetical protein